MTDPVQLLIDAGAIPPARLGRLAVMRTWRSRAYQVSATEPGVAYVLRRFVPQHARHSGRDDAHRQSGDRIESLAAHYLATPS